MWFDAGRGGWGRRRGGSFAPSVHRYIDPSRDVCELDSDLLCGVYHANEIAFVFGDFTNFKRVEPRDTEMAAAMGLYWTNMAKLGTPNSADVPTQWPKFDAATDQHLLLELPVVVRRLPAARAAPRARNVCSGRAL